MPRIVSTKSLEAELAKLQKRITKAEGARVKVVRSIAKQIEAHGIDLAEIKAAMGGKSTRTGGSVRKGRKLGSVAIKYRDNDGNTWTGRGNTPRWLVAAEKAGKKRESFAV